MNSILNKIGVYNMRQILKRKLYIIASLFFRRCGVIWYNSLGDSHFQIHVMNFVENVLDFYSHITSHVSQVFASCTHYTSFSLLNFVYAIVCDFGLANQVWKFLEFLQNMFDAWEFKENGLKILILGKLGSKLVFLKKISSHINAFYS